MLDGERPEGRRGPWGEERWAWRKGWGESLAKVWAGKESVCEVLEGAAGWIAIVGREAKVGGGGILRGRRVLMQCWVGTMLLSDSKKV